MTYQFKPEPDILPDDLTNGGPNGKTIVDVTQTKSTSNGGDDPPKVDNEHFIIVYRANRLNGRPISHQIISDKSPVEYLVYADSQDELLQYLLDTGINSKATKNSITIIEELDQVRRRLLKEKRKEIQEMETSIEDAPPLDSKSPIYTYSISDLNKHDHNNTGVIIERVDGAPMSSKEAYQFIQDEIKAGNSEFKRLFPRIQIDSSKEIPKFTIPNDKHWRKYKHYNYHFDPEWREKMEPSDKYVGKQVDISARAKQRLRIWSAPIRNNAVKSNDGSVFYIEKDERITIIGIGNEHGPDWVKVRTQSGMEGWQNPNYFDQNQGNLLKDGVTSTTIVVQENAKLSDLLNENYTDQKIGFDNYDYAMAVSILNEGSPVIYHDDQEQSLNDTFVETYKKMIDGGRAKLRENLRTIKLRHGYRLRLPTKEYVIRLRENGQIGTRSDLANATIYAGRATMGMISGIRDGFISAGVDTVTGLWDMVKGIFTGQLFSDLKTLYDTFMSMSWEELYTTLKAVFGNLLDDFLKKVNTNNVEARHYAIGQLIGAIVFEIVLAVLTGGAGLLAKLEKIPRLQKIVTVIRKTQRAMADTKDAVLDKLPSLRTNKKISNRHSKGADKDYIEFDKQSSKELSEKLKKKDANEKVTDDVNDSDTNAADKKKAKKHAERILTSYDNKVKSPEEMMPALNGLALMYKGVRGFSYNTIGGTYANIYMHGSKIRVRSSDGTFNIIDDNNNVTPSDRKKVEGKKENGQIYGIDKIGIPDNLNSELNDLYSRKNGSGNSFTSEDSKRLIEIEATLTKSLDDGLSLEERSRIIMKLVKSKSTAELRRGIIQKRLAGLNRKEIDRLKPGNKNVEKSKKQLEKDKDDRDLDIGFEIPANFQAHHIFPEEIMEKFEEFFKQIEISLKNNQNSISKKIPAGLQQDLQNLFKKKTTNPNIQDGAFNGLEMPANRKILEQAIEADPMNKLIYEHFAFHSGSHSVYTSQVEMIFEKISDAFSKGDIDAAQALNSMEVTLMGIEQRLMHGNLHKDFKPEFGDKAPIIKDDVVANSVKLPESGIDILRSKYHGMSAKERFDLLSNAKGSFDNEKDVLMLVYNKMSKEDKASIPKF